MPRLALPVRASLNLQLRIAKRAQELGVTVNDYVLACVKRDLEQQNS